MKLPGKLVSFMESREEILVRQMPIKEEEEEVGRWGFKVDQTGESHHPWSDRPLNLRLNSFVENFNDEEQGLKVAVAFDTYVQDGRVETCGRSEYFEIPPNTLKYFCKYFHIVVYKQWQLLPNILRIVWQIL